MPRAGAGAAGFIVAVMVWAAGAATANAATLRLGPADPSLGGQRELQYVAAPGERNHLKAVVVWDPFGDVPYDYYAVITDLGARITSTAPGCTAFLNTATCAVQGVSTVVADLGDGNDRALLDGPGTVLRGGPGDDVLHVQQSEGAGVLLSGPTVDGGPGADTLTTLPSLSAAIGLDFLAGAAVSYLGHAAGVSVTLDGERNDGAPGERDLVGTGFSVLVGSQSADELHGTSSGELVIGHGGDDRLFGAAGKDQLQGGPGADVLDGGPGEDTVLAHADYLTNTQDTSPDRLLLRDGEADRGECESFGDVAIADPVDQLTGPCSTGAGG